jgi:hypothetical protein
MIQHISFAVQNPQLVANVLAEFWETEALSFPMYENSYIVFCGQESSNCIELYPEGKSLHPSTPELPGLQTDNRQLGGAFHAALSVPIEEERIHEICQNAGWLCQTGPRGPFFKVVEVWVEGHTLLELLPPEMSKEYMAFANVQNWKTVFGLL